MVQTLDLFSSSDEQQSNVGEVIDIAKLHDLTHADLLLYPQFFAATEAESIFTSLMDELVWQQEDIELFGKRHKVPRLSCWYGECNLSYTYSGITAKTLPWTPLLNDIKNRVNRLIGAEFNSVLCNCYRNGDDGVGWHADDESELGHQPMIASLSFGGLRRFQLKHRFQPAMRHTMTLPHGSLLLMKGQTQSHWLHQLAKSKKALMPRINLTFRRII